MSKSRCLESGLCSDTFLCESVKMIWARFDEICKCPLQLFVNETKHGDTTHCLTSNDTGQNKTQHNNATTSITTASTKTQDAEYCFIILNITVKAILLGIIMLTGILLIVIRLNVMAPLHVPQFKTTRCPNFIVVKNWFITFFSETARTVENSRTNLKLIGPTTLVIFSFCYVCKKDLLSNIISETCSNFC